MKQSRRNSRLKKLVLNVVLGGTFALFSACAGMSATDSWRARQAGIRGEKYEEAYFTGTSGYFETWAYRFGATALALSLLPGINYFKNKREAPQSFKSCY